MNRTRLGRLSVARAASVAISVILSLLLVSVLPTAALAQYKSQSANYILSDVNFGDNVTLTTNQDSIAPAISSQGPQITELQPKQATVTWVTDKKSSSTVDYGTTTAYGFQAGAAGFSTTHSVTLYGLSPETTYHYKVISSDSLGATGESIDYTFTTPAETIITSISITDIGYDKALVSWRTGNFSLSTLEVGETIAYGQTKSSTSRGYTTDHVVPLTELKSGTTYHYRIAAEDERGQITRSNDLTFTTIPLPKFTNINVTVQSENTALLQWQTNTPTSSIVKYKAQSGPNVEEQTAGSSNLEINHSMQLSRLVGNVTYQLQITATDNLGKQVKSDQKIFSTPIDKDPPKLTDLKVAVTRTGDQIVLTATWKTNEPAKDEMVYSSKTNLNLTVDVPGTANYVTDHTMVATGLNPATPYGLTVFGTDAAGNRGQAEISFVSPKLSKSIFQLIIDSFLSKFGWLINLLNIK